MTEAVIGDIDPTRRMWLGDMTAAVACETWYQISAMQMEPEVLPFQGNYEMIERRNFICFIQHCFPEISTGPYLIFNSLKIGR